MSSPNSSPAMRVNLLIMEHAPNTANRKSRRDVHTHTLHSKWQTLTNFKQSPSQKFNIAKSSNYQAVQAKYSLCPNSFLSLAKLYINVYIRTVGSATPRMSSGCPPMIEWIMPHTAVEARVWTAVKDPSAVTIEQRHVILKLDWHCTDKNNCSAEALKHYTVPVVLSSCTPKDMTGIEEAKKT